MKRLPFHFSAFYSLNHIQGRDRNVIRGLGTGPTGCSLKMKLLSDFDFSNEWPCSFLLDSQPWLQPLLAGHDFHPSPQSSSPEINIHQQLCFSDCAIYWDLQQGSMHVGADSIAETKLKKQSYKSVIKFMVLGISPYIIKEINKVYLIEMFISPKANVNSLTILKG